MALLHTPVSDPELLLPDFALKATDGRIYSESDIAGENGTVLLFICNHCPYVKGLIARLVEDCGTLRDEGFGVGAIMPNDTDSYPEDSFENMKMFARNHGFTFPYMIDETQEVAQACGAACTPDIFGFNADRVLQYRGRLDSAGPKERQADTKRELIEAMRLIGSTGHGPTEQFPSMGCSIKWKK